MPIELDYYDKLKPVSLSVRDDNIILDKSIITTQQGNTLLEYNFLLSANDCIIKNYTSNYLSYNFNKNDIIDVNIPENINDSIVSDISFKGSLSTFYLSLIPNNTTSTSQAILTGSSNDLIQEFIIDFQNVNGDSVCTISSYDKFYKKYLFIQEDNNNSIVFSSTSGTYFKHVYDNVLDKLNLFYTLSSGQFNWIIANEITNTLSAVTPNVSRLSALNLDIIDQAKNIENYSTDNFVLYDSDTSIDQVNSLSGIKTNFLFHTSYENWTPSITSVDGTIDFFNLKNYTSKNNFINRLPPFVNKQQRNYNSIITNDYQETANEKLQLGFDFYTKEFLIKPDKYTKFVLPENIEPFSRININDSGFKEAGAYAANSPYFSDRVYKLQDNNLNPTINESNGVFLCSWLNAKDGIWYDRYYIPQRSSYITALSTSTVPTYTYKSELSAFIEKNGLENINFYDVNSSLMLEPSGTYYYARIGNKYIDSVLSGKSANLIKNGFEAFSLSAQNVSPLTDKMLLDGDVYDYVNIGEILTGRFNVSLRVDTPNLENLKAYQLIGNKYNLGFSIRKNFYFTPFVIIQNNNDLYFYNTDFEIIKKNTYDINTVGNIKDVCYVTQTNDIVLRTSNGFFRTDITGQIIYSNTGVSNGIKNNVTGRTFYSDGNRALFITNDAYPYQLSLVDLQTLNVATLDTISSLVSSVVALTDNSYATLPGIKGVNINDTYGASISANNLVVFTDLINLTSFVALSTYNDNIQDISAFDNNLYIQSNNNVYIFNTERELLSTIALSVSAATGFKLDFITENYVTKLLSFSRKNDDNLIVDKISLSTGEILSTYQLPFSSVSIGDVFTNPTGFNFAETTYKKYEDKMCINVSLPNTLVASASSRVWSTFTRSWSAVTPPQYWAFNYSSIFKLNNNSYIDYIPFKGVLNHIDLDFNLYDGLVSLFINGEKTNQISISANNLTFDGVLKNILYVGNQNYSTGSITDYVTNQSFLAKNATVSDFKVYNISLSDDFIKYLYMRGIPIDSINIDITSGTRSSIETIDNIFKYNIPGRLSNDITVYIKSSGISEGAKSTLVDILDEKLKAVLPVNIGKITYNLEIQ